MQENFKQQCINMDNEMNKIKDMTRILKEEINITKEKGLKDFDWKIKQGVKMTTKLEEIERNIKKHLKMIASVENTNNELSGGNKDLYGKMAKINHQIEENLNQHQDT